MALTTATLYYFKIGVLLAIIYMGQVPEIKTDDDDDDDDRWIVVVVLSFECSVLYCDNVLW